MSFNTRKLDQRLNVCILLTKKRKVRFSRLELCDNFKYGRTIFDITIPVNIRILLTKKRKMRFSRLELWNNSINGRTIYGTADPVYGMNILPQQIYCYRKLMTNKIALNTNNDSINIFYNNTISETLYLNVKKRKWDIWGV